MTDFTYSANTTQFNIGVANRIVALKVDPTETNWFTILDEVQASASGNFTLEWADWAGRVIVGAVDNDVVVQLDCVFHDFQIGIPPTTPGTIPTANLVRNYTLDNVGNPAILDSTGNANGTKTGTVVSVTGQIGNAGEFARVGRINTSYIVGATSGFTYSFWFNRDNSAVVGAEEYIMGDGTGSSTNTRIGLGFNSSGNVLIGAGNGVGTLDLRDTGFSITPFHDSGWHHCILRGVNNNRELIIDNVSRATEAYPSLPNTIVGLLPVYIGALGTLAAASYAGSIDAFKIYERALTNEEVTALFNETA